MTSDIYIYRLFYNISIYIYRYLSIYIYTPPGQKLFLLGFPTLFPHRLLPNNFLLKKFLLGSWTTDQIRNNYIKTTSRFDPPRRPREMALRIIKLIRRGIYMVLFSNSGQEKTVVIFRPSEVYTYIYGNYI